MLALVAGEARTKTETRATPVTALAAIARIRTIVRAAYFIARVFESIQDRVARLEV